MSNQARSEEFPKGSGIRIREKINTSGECVYGTSYAVLVPVKVTGGARIRKQFKTLEKAKEFAKQQHAGKQAQGQVFFDATDRERGEFADLLPKLREAGITLREAVEFALPRLRPAGGDKTFDEVISEMRDMKKKMLMRGTLREPTERVFRVRSDKVGVEFGATLIRNLTLDETIAWLESLDVAPRTIKNDLACLGEILRYAVSRKYATENILDALTETDRKNLYGHAEEQEPEALTPSEAGRLLNTALEKPKLELLGAVTLGLFCGIRTEELKKLDWKDIRLDEGFVTIGSNIAKKRSIRNVTLSENAAKWLTLCVKKEGPLTHSRTYGEYHRNFERLLKAAGFVKPSDKGKASKVDWKRNAMRHSFGTYHFALYGDSIKTSNEMGHRQGDSVLFANYRKLATKKQAQSYFGIVPPKSAEKVVDFA